MPAFILYMGVKSVLNFSILYLEEWHEHQNSVDVSSGRCTYIGAKVHIDTGSEQCKYCARFMLRE